VIACPDAQNLINLRLSSKTMPYALQVLTEKLHLIERLLKVRNEVPKEKKFKQEIEWDETLKRRANQLREAITILEKECPF
jgi:hypothetical protein